MKKFELSWLFYYICSNTKTLQQCHWTITDCTVYYSSTKTESLKNWLNLSDGLQKYRNINCWWKLYKPSWKGQIERRVATSILRSILDPLWLTVELCTMQHTGGDVKITSMLKHRGSLTCTQKHTLWGNSLYSVPKRHRASKSTNTTLLCEMFNNVSVRC